MSYLQRNEKRQTLISIKLSDFIARRRRCDNSSCRRRRLVARRSIVDALRWPHDQPTTNSPRELLANRWPNHNNNHHQRAASQQPPPPSSSAARLVCKSARDHQPAAQSSIQQLALQVSRRHCRRRVSFRWPLQDGGEGTSEPFTAKCRAHCLRVARIGRRQVELISSSRR